MSQKPSFIGRVGSICCECNTVKPKKHCLYSSALLRCGLTPYTNWPPRSMEWQQEGAL